MDYTKLTKSELIALLQADDADRAELAARLDAIGTGRGWLSDLLSSCATAVVVVFLAAVFYRGLWVAINKVALGVKPGVGGRATRG